MSSSTVKLKLNESQELKFKLHVQGTTSEPGAQNPQFRFVLTEKDGDGNSLGLVFPVRKEENGTVAVCIPSMDEGIIKENKYYVGKMEVLMGSRYFTPTVLDIQFEKEFKITAEAIVHKQPGAPEVVNEAGNYDSSQASVTSEYVSVVSSKPQVVTPAKTKAPTAPQVVAPKAPIAIAKQKQPFKITAEDIKRANGNDARLKAIISERVAEQIPADSQEFHLYVDHTYKKVKTMLAEQNKKQGTSTNGNSKLLEGKDKIDVEDLMGVLFKNKE